MKHCGVKDVMTREVVRVGSEAPFKQVARLLSEHRIGGLPVLDDEGRTVGVISATDLLQHQAQQGEHHGRRYVRRPRLTRSARAAAAKARAGTAEHLMTRPPVTATEQQYVTEAARTMWEHRVERLPVEDEDGRLVGIVTRGDLLRVFLRPDEEIRRDVTGQVAVGLGLHRHAVDVTVDGGVVVLRGHLERRDDSGLAVRIAARVDGVITVTDHLTHRSEGVRARAVIGASGHM
ncbi:CBS domain-containing protein [Streptomyces sp. NPDC048179]|uniref:CBS domain-containing protein n=1 Tax=Streptomyces sp. NPDC048179 TaxID=3365506 RepID=UPI003712612D